MSASNGELIVGGQQRNLMIPTRLPMLASIAVIAVMIFNCGVAIAGPDEASADYFMPGCRDAASLITLSVRESEEEAARMNWRGLLLASASWGNFTAYVCRLARPRNKPPVSSFSTSTDGLQGLTKTFGLLPLRLCEQTGRVLQAIPSGPGNLSPGKRAEINGEISHGRRGGLRRISPSYRSC